MFESYFLTAQVGTIVDTKHLFHVPPQNLKANQGITSPMNKHGKSNE